jgi:hypothetical protein
MAVINFSTLSGELLPYVPGVPDPVLEFQIRKTVRDLCSRALVWRVNVTDVPVVAETSTYTLVPPTDTEVVSVLQARLYRTAADLLEKMMIGGAEELYAKYPTWPDVNRKSYPQLVSSLDPHTINVAPVPDDADTYLIKIQVAVRPTLTADGCEEFILQDFRREIFHGVLHELMMMPNRAWTDEKKAIYHGQQWAFFLAQARARATKGFGRGEVAVKQRPWA